MCRPYEQQKLLEASVKAHLVIQSRVCFGVFIVLMHRFSNATLFLHVFYIYMPSATSSFLTNHFFGAALARLEPKSEPEDYRTCVQPTKRLLMSMLQMHSGSCRSIPNNSNSLHSYFVPILGSAIRRKPRNKPCQHVGPCYIHSLERLHGQHDGVPDENVGVGMVQELELHTWVGLHDI